MRLEPFKKKGSDAGGPFKMKLDLSLDDGKKKLTAEEKLLYAKGRRNDWCKEYLHTG